MNSFSEAQSFCTQHPSGSDTAIASFIVPGSMVNVRAKLCSTCEYLFLLDQQSEFGASFDCFPQLGVLLN